MATKAKQDLIATIPTSMAVDIVKELFAKVVPSTAAETRNLVWELIEVLDSSSDAPVALAEWFENKLDDLKHDLTHELETRED